MLPGSLELKGLHSRVEVVRDRLGVPHARASTVADAFFAQGFAQSQDRFWQMDFDRMRATGRWSEYVGRDGLEQDRLIRKLGFERSARRDYAAYDGATRAMLDAFTAGVNAFLQTSSPPSLEHQLLDVTPEPWQPWHSGAIFRLRHYPMGSANYKLWRLRVLHAAGADWLSRLGADSEGPPTIVTAPKNSHAYSPAVASSPADDGGSNNWAIHGGRTASGAPLVAGDPHRVIDVPNVYYQNQIGCPEFDVIGLSFPGVPGFPHFGHNPHVCWCVTHGMIDNQDLFLERFSRDDPTRYEFQGEWRLAEIMPETLFVRDGDPIAMEVTRTHHGPIVLGDPAASEAIALAYTATADVDRTFDGLLPMMRARTVDDLEEAMRPWVEPCNNFVMADVHGTIGYLTRGKVPLRPETNGWLAVPGWSGEHEWNGVIPFEQMPRLRNPEIGCIVTANNRIAGAEYPYYLSSDWRPAWRASRIADLLDGRSQLKAEDMPAIHADSLSNVGPTFIELAREIAPDDEVAGKSRELLLQWDGRMAPDSAAASVYAVWREMLNALIMDQPAFAGLEDAAAQHELVPSQAIPIASRVRGPLHSALARRDASVLPARETWQSLGSKALATACAWLAERFGAEPAGWSWQRVHRTGPRHVLSSLFPDRAEWLDPPSVGVGGDSETPLAAGYRELGEDGFVISTTAVARYCFDLADWDRSGWVIPLGASGHPGSAHYADQVSAWAEQRLLPMTYAWSRLQAEASEIQELIPVPENRRG